ncbi:Protein kinase domain-containing protein [Cinnamomum micranthum f. kanehirae]|uniref:non-specific serine/threonine protein kinase n=1 Tax=Cinnamomum micranthum f. kanehirae TaxID=337451 RepID=A0A3S3NA88_9MAGN|nr:Protein kinase domain-containing protein [Cinnamomum micranthum f. kanehirae]
MGLNRFTGYIPVSLGNATRLTILDFCLNNFSGSMPMNLGGLKGLEQLSVETNQLVSENDEEFTFITSLMNCSDLQVLALDRNLFTGKLPNSIANLSTKLTELWLGENQFFGAIPSGIENLANLILLDLGHNLLTGTIPIYLMKLRRLQALYMVENKLSGQIPISLGNLTQLHHLDLSRNYLRGSIPSSLGYCRLLQYLHLNDNNLNGTIPENVLNIPTLLELDMSMNSLSGSLPLDICKSKSLIALTIFNNRLSGEIPNSLGTCVNLGVLYMQGNLFHGSIPPSLSALVALQVLDLSYNNLTGSIPRDLANLSFLRYLNLSFNNLEGEVIENGIFQNASAVSICGNNKLCGGISELQLPKCSKQDLKKQERPHSRKEIILVVVAVVLFLFLLLLCFFVIRSKKLREKISFTSFKKESFLRITYGELLRATNGFSLANLIGVGSYSSVYKGILSHMETIVAIKVLRLQQRRASKSFSVECMVLRSIRHRNIVRILTVCSSLDFSGNDFKALVLEYMPNGSLDSWLHSSTNGDERLQLKSLSFVQRLNVAIDIACALDYLHNHCEAPIIHCDLKPSNVLLDEDMVAHVGDFGLARILSKDFNYSQSQTNSLTIRGTIGYVAPEYGTGAITSTSGDVYSYGIVLLEMLTGKRPSDDMFENNLSLHQFAKMALPERVMEIIDHGLLSEEIEIIGHSENSDNIRSKMQEALISLVEIGVSCSHESPKKRMEMKDVVIEMQKVKGFYLRPIGLKDSVSRKRRNEQYSSSCLPEETRNTPEEDLPEEASNPLEEVPPEEARNAPEEILSKRHETLLKRLLPKRQVMLLKRHVTLLKRFLLKRQVTLMKMFLLKRHITLLQLW